MPSVSMGCLQVPHHGWRQELCVDKHTNTDVSIISGRLTSELQLVDVGWNKPFKAAYETKCEGVPSEIIKKSFWACGISVSMDGTADGEIHCLKQGGVAAEAREAIAEGTASLLSRSDDDPFTDNDELEENELVLDDGLLNLNFMTSCLFRVYNFMT